MNLAFLHPREQLVEILQRIYDFGMTTTSGGNLSIRDEEGNIWITPSAVDKGSLKPQDIVCIRNNGLVEGIHKPSSEYPFHLAVYKVRPDLKAIVHAHPSALVSFSIVRKPPDTGIIPQARNVCGPVGYAPYELPGSEELGFSIAKSFGSNYNAVLLENHGIVVGGTDLSDAFQRFETLEFCARMQIEAASIGDIKSLNDVQIDLFYNRKTDLPEMERFNPEPEEAWMRGELCKMVKRAYNQRLIISTYGTFSVRLSGNNFLITPFGMDRFYLERDDFVLVKDGKKEKGKLPSRSVKLHQRIYTEHNGINSIISAQSPFATAYCVAGKSFDTRTIPESYILLREIPLVPYGDQFREGVEISKLLSKETPILLLENDALMVTGKSLIETFDRLEVAEFTARSLTQSARLGELKPITEKEIKDLKKKFLS